MVMQTISVIIPTYNCGAFISNTINSVLSQQSGDFNIEIIVVNDGSTDNTSEVMEEFRDRVHYIYKKNGGVASARNVGIRHALGEYLYFLDADDVLMPNWLFFAFNAFQKHQDIGVVHGGFQRWEAGPEENPSSNYHTLSSKQNELGDAIDIRQTGWIYHQMLLNSWVLCSAAMIRREWVERCGGFEEGVPMGEDWSFWMRVSRNCQFLKMQRTAVLYRQHPNQATRKVYATNYAVKFIEDSVKQYGFSGSDGVAARREDVYTTLSKHLLWHAVDHFRSGDYRIGMRSITKAIRYQPFSIKNWRLFFLAISGLARPYLRFIAHL